MARQHPPPGTRLIVAFGLTATVEWRLAPESRAALITSAAGDGHAEGRQCHLQRRDPHEASTSDYQLATTLQLAPRIGYKRAA